MALVAASLRVPFAAGAARPRCSSARPPGRRRAMCCQDPGRGPAGLQSRRPPGRAARRNAPAAARHASGPMALKRPSLRGGGGRRSNNSLLPLPGGSWCPPARPAGSLPSCRAPVPPRQSRAPRRRSQAMIKVWGAPRRWSQEHAHSQATRQEPRARSPPARRRWVTGTEHLGTARRQRAAIWHIAFTLGSAGAAVLLAIGCGSARQPVLVADVGMSARRVCGGGRGRGRGGAGGGDDRGGGPAARAGAGRSAGRACLVSRRRVRARPGGHGVACVLVAAAVATAAGRQHGSGSRGGPL